jgi:NTE family protein
MTWKSCNNTLNGFTASEPAQPRAARTRTGKGRRLAGNTARLCLACLVLLNAACAHFSAADKPLKQWSPDLGQSVDRQVEGDRSRDIAVLVAFSGGGSRASAFAYGVLQELADTEVMTAKGSRSLLREVDMISSVSGGSFTAAYYGLYGKQIFTDFEERFLRKDVEGVLFRKLFNPLNWVRLMSGSYGRSDLAAEYYDKILFNGATFADLQRPDAPLIDINATDLATGNRFPFIEWTFGMICADFGSYPLSRAVAASSAVPVVFSPITLENFAGSCGYQPPAWVAEAGKDEALTLQKIEARRFESYLDRHQRPWLHLVDGGIADNLGMRAFYRSLNIADEPGNQHRGLDYSEARHVIIISVNAFAKHKSRWVLERYAPSLFEIIGRVSADQISRYSEDTIEIVHSTFEGWVKEKSTPGRPVTFHFVDVSFNQVRDDSERDFLNSIGTNFDLSDEQVDRLIAAARKVLRESTELKAFIESSRGDD